MNETSQPPYLLGHSAEELSRLEEQSLFFNAETDDTLSSAGLLAGMTVLDVGCGAGDVAIAAARIVGPSGRVLAIDTSEQAVALANQRFARQELSWARAEVRNAFAVDENGYDAAIGRFILMHLSDPASLLRQLRTVLKPVGILAFLEMDIGSASIEPPMALFEQGVRAIVDVYRASGSEPDMGSRLYATFRRAGLNPRLKGSCRVEGGPDAQVYEYLARSVESLSPAMRLNAITPPFTEAGRYAQALKAEARRLDHSVAHPRLTAAWARA